MVVWLLQQSFILLLSFLVCTSLAYAQLEFGSEQRNIREVRVYISNIYSEEQALESSWSEFANKYHMTTRESVIRNEVLFKEGDVLDEELLKESERKLRRFSFLSEAKIEVIPVDEQTVDIEIRTRDAWSLTPGLDIDGGGGLGTVKAHLMEVNLLGYGKKAFIEGIYESDVGTTTKLGYRDYQLFNSRWNGSATYVNGPLVEGLYLQAVKPLYHLDSKWSYGGSTYTADQIIRRFEDGEESSRFASEQIMAQGFLKRSYGERYNKLKLKFQLKYLKKDFSSLGAETTEPPPEDQANITPLVKLTKEHNLQWEKFSFLNKMGRTEDNWLGQTYGAHLGYGIPVQGGFELWDVGAFVSDNRTFAHQQLLKSDLNINSEVVRNTSLTAIAKYYNKFSWHTVATRFKINYGYELDSTRQYTLGANNGLRGYPARQFTGERLMLINLEDRQFWGNYQLGPEIALGSVVFVDAGNVWKEEETIELKDLNWSTGVGLRLGFLNLPKQPIFRLDLGWAVGDNSGFAVTFGQEQHFR
jgi:hypothetical protein